MGNCKLVHNEHTGEVVTQPNQPYEQGSQLDINKSKQIFNHNAKNNSSYQTQQMKGMMQNFEFQSGDQIIPRDLQGETHEEQQQQIFVQSPSEHPAQQSQEYSYQFNNSQQPVYVDNVYIDESLQNEEKPQEDLNEFRRQLQEDVHDLELNPPQFNRDLPPFNYGEDPQYPLEYRVEMRTAQRLPDGSTYVGEWNQDYIHGKGVMDGENGKYEGYWSHGKKLGRGRFTYIQGDVYEGDWNDDHIEGMGTYYYNNGIIYNGEWKNEKRNGVGKEIFSNTASYEGEFVDDQKDGQGVFIWKDNTKYTGFFKQNKINGNGVMEYSNGRKFEGVYKDGLMHGKGKFYWPDQRVYEGEYQNDRKHGQGKLIYIDGRQYIGGWVNGQMDGQGQITVGNHIRKGMWVAGKRIKWLD